MKLHFLAPSAGIAEAVPMPVGVGDEEPPQDRVSEICSLAGFFRFTTRILEKFIGAMMHKV